VRRAKLLEPTTGTDDTKTNFDRPTMAGPPRIDTGSGSQPASPGSEVKKAGRGSDARPRTGPAKKALPVAKLLEGGPPSSSGSMPAIQIKTTDSALQRAEPSKSVSAVSDKEKELRFRRRLSDVLFYAVVAAGLLALGSMGVLMLMHT
jgi:hypothetical protein